MPLGDGIWAAPLSTVLGHVRSRPSDFSGANFCMTDILIPVFRLVPGSKKNKHPVYVMSNGQDYCQGSICDSSVLSLAVLAACTGTERPTQPEISRGEGCSVHDGSCAIQLCRRSCAALGCYEKHEYVSFHSYGKINHPAKIKFRWQRCVPVLDQFLCRHSDALPPFDWPPWYLPTLCSPPPFCRRYVFAGLYGAYPNAERIPLLTRDQFPQFD